MMTDDCPAVVVFAYNRLDHIRQTLEMAHSPDIDTYSIYVFCDAEQKTEYSQVVDEVRSYVEEWGGERRLFAQINRPSNFGLARNIISGVSDVLKVHESVIVLEDDLVVSHDFLNVMSELLRVFRVRSDVMSIGGFVPDFAQEYLSDLQSDFWLNWRPNSWGLGNLARPLEKCGLECGDLWIFFVVAKGVEAIFPNGGRRCRHAP